MVVPHFAHCAPNWQAKRVSAGAKRRPSTRLEQRRDFTCASKLAPVSSLVLQLWACSLENMERIWQIEDNYPESLIGKYDRKAGPDRLLLRRGKTLSKEEKEWKFTFEASVKQLYGIDDLANCTLTPLVSPKLASLIGEYTSNDVEFLPARIQACDGEITDYQLLNSLSTKSAVDFEESDPVFIPGTDAVMKFNRLRLRKNSLGTHHIARCEEYRSYLLISNVLADAIENSGMTFSLPESITA